MKFGVPLFYRYRGKWIHKVLLYHNRRRVALHAFGRSPGGGAVYMFNPGCVGADADPELASYEPASLGPAEATRLLSSIQARRQ